MSPLSIGISSVGRFHMFDLARQMLRLGQLPVLYTGYPNFKIDADLRPITRTRSRWVVLEAARRRCGGYSSRAFTWWSNQVLEDFGPWVARRLDNVDILDALAGTGWEAGRELRRRGTAWICNRGSTHIVSQIELLQEEHRRWGAPPLYVDTGRPMERCLGEYEEADAIVVPSSFAGRTFINRGIPQRKLYVCPYGADLATFRPVAKSDRKFRVLFVGSYSLRKGIGYLFDAVRPLVKRGTVEMWFVGAPSHEVERVLKANRDIFQDFGPQPRSRLSWFYSQASVLVLPSLEEGLALVLAQAMACGLPVITTPNSGAEDLIADGAEGFIVPARDSEAIRERIERLVDDPAELSRMSTAALRCVTSIGGWDRYGERCLEIYRDVISLKQKT